MAKTTILALLTGFLHGCAFAVVTRSLTPFLRQIFGCIFVFLYLAAAAAASLTQIGQPAEVMLKPLAEIGIILAGAVTMLKISRWLFPPCTE